jgi:hypothetical protein
MELKTEAVSNLKKNHVKLISSASGTEGGEVFYRLMDWLGSRDPLTPYNTHVAHRFGLAD